MWPFPACPLRACQEQPFKGTSKIKNLTSGVKNLMRQAKVGVAYRHWAMGYENILYVLKINLMAMGLGGGSTFHRAEPYPAFAILGITEMELPELSVDDILVEEIEDVVGIIGEGQAGPFMLAAADGGQEEGPANVAQALGNGIGAIEG